MKKTLTGVFLFLLVASSANAALLSRLSGAAYYDDVLDITWLADANAGAGSIYDDGPSSTDGQMTWNSAQAWIASLNTANYLGTNDWRLPIVTDTGTPGCDWAYTGTDCGYNVDLSTGEMAHLFYSTLGNVGNFNTGGGLTGCAGANYCLTNTGPFSNLQPHYYWSGTEYAPTTSNAWSFVFFYGFQYNYPKYDAFYAWAVSPGDIAPVPGPGTVWLLGSALGLVGWVRRR